jgi:hypothetical protein
VGGLLDRNASNVTVSNSTTETTIYSYNVPAGLLGTTRGLRVRIRGTYTNNSGSNKTIRLRLKLGATTVLDKTSAAVATSATAANFFSTFIISNAGATNSQEAAMQFLADRAGAIVGPIIMTGTAAVDTTSAQTLTITITHSAASASTTFVKEGAYTVLE